MNTQKFSIGGYKAEFTYFLLTKEEAMYVFNYFCRTSTILQNFVILRSEEVLVPKEYIEMFVEVAQYLSIYFMNVEGKFTQKYEDDCYFSRNTVFIRAKREKQRKQKMLLHTRNAV